jgi:hypothetical protein
MAFTLGASMLRRMQRVVGDRVSTPPGVPRPLPGRSACSAGVQAADFGGDGRGRGVERHGGVHGGQRADAGRPAVLVRCGQRRRRQPVELVPRLGVVAGDRDLGRARAVHLDEAVAEAARSLSAPSSLCGWKLASITMSPARAASVKGSSRAATLSRCGRASLTSPSPGTCRASCSVSGKSAGSAWSLCVRAAAGRSPAVSPGASARQKESRTVATLTESARAPLDVLGVPLLARLAASRKPGF